MFGTKKVKIYSVKFIRYTDYSRDTVSNDAEEIKDSIYLDVGTEPFLIREDQIEFYKQFGGGIASLTFVGNLAVGDEDD